MTLDENLPAENFLEVLGQHMKGQIELENREIVGTKWQKHCMTAEKHAEFMGLAATVHPSHHLTPTRKSKTGCDIIRKGWSQSGH